MADQASRAYYDRKCAEGKRHNQVRDGVGSSTGECFVCNVEGWVFL